jgi:hypothetical protein
MSAAATGAAGSNVGSVMSDNASKTAGGRQLWADVWFFHDWRIQRNVLNGSYRLLDGGNRRHAKGSLDDCRSELNSIRTRDELPAMQGKAVIVLHGLFRTRSAMKSLCTILADQGGYATVNVGYPSTRGSVADHAATLESVVRSLEGFSELNFVAHSLGNLVVRYWLGEMARQNRTLPTGQKFGRMVMLAPPNDHPRIAAALLGNRLAARFTGPASEQMATGWKSLAPKLAIPHFEFGVIAGGQGKDRGYNPLLRGDNDGVVTVASTRLPQASDFRLVRVLHSFVMSDARVHDLTLRFLQHGHFEDHQTRQPIASE